MAKCTVCQKRHSHSVLGVTVLKKPVFQTAALISVFLPSEFTSVAGGIVNGKRREMKSWADLVEQDVPQEREGES